VKVLLQHSRATRVILEFLESTRKRLGAGPFQSFQQSLVMQDSIIDAAFGGQPRLGELVERGGNVGHDDESSR